LDNGFEQLNVELGNGIAVEIDLIVCSILRNVNVDILMDDGCMQRLSAGNPGGNSACGAGEGTTGSLGSRHVSAPGSKRCACSRWARRSGDPPGKASINSRTTGMQPRTCGRFAT